MEGMNAVGDIITKISVNCVILFTCSFLWVYRMYGL
jgi:hypothetical protein